MADLTTSGLEGDGATEVLVAPHDGKVILRFPRPKEWVGFDPQNAMMVAGAMAKEAYELRFKRPANDIELSRIFGDIRKEVTAQQVEVLVNRVVLIMNTGLEKKHPPLYTAQAIVNRILADIR